MSDQPPGDQGDPGDELRVEVSARASRTPHATPPAVPAPLPSRLTTRGRAMRLLAAAGALLLALVVVLAASPLARAGLQTYVSGFFPTPTPTIIPGTDAFELLPSPPGTTVLLDGHPLSRLAYPGDPQPLRFARGQHTLTWRSSAFPFDPLSCTVFVPYPYLFRQPANTCTFLTAQDLPAPLNQEINPPRIIGQHLTLLNLPADQIAALRVAIRRALSSLQSNALVQPGELTFAVAPGQNGAPVAATQPLRATLFVTPVEQSIGYPCFSMVYTIDPCQYTGQDCALICTLPTPSASASASAGAQPAWLAGVQVRLSWDYATLDGRTIASDVGPAYGFGIEQMLVRITWDGSQWHVAPIIGHHPGLPAADELTCEPAIQWLIQGPVDDFLYPDNVNDLAFGDASSPVLTDGCVLRIAARGNPGNAVPVVPGAPALFIERFGVLLAVNAAAHTLWPALPRADPVARALAEQLALPLG